MAIGDRWRPAGYNTADEPEPVATRRYSLTGAARGASERAAFYMMREAVMAQGLAAETAAARADANDPMTDEEDVEILPVGIVEANLSEIYRKIVVGANCYVTGAVHQRTVRVLLDTGAQVNVIRTATATAMTRGKDTAPAIGPRTKDTGTLTCSGIEGSKGTILSHSRNIKITMMEPNHIAKGTHNQYVPGKRATRDLSFVELDGAADGLLVGCSALAEWGYGLSSDDTGRMWVELRKLGLLIPCERKPRGQGAIKPITTIVVEGPRVAPVPVRAPRLVVETLIE